MGAIENIIKYLNKQNIYTAYKFPKAEFDDQLKNDIIRKLRIELRTTTYKIGINLKLQDGKIGKPKHNMKIFLFGGISR